MDNTKPFGLLGIPLPVYIDRNGQAKLKLNPGKNLKPPVFVHTIPKSGTYFIVELLKNLEVSFCGAQISTHNLVDHRFASLEMLREKPGEVSYKIPLKISQSLIARGQFSVGHIAPSSEVSAALSRFVQVFLYRDLRNVVVSCTRYYGFIRKLDVCPVFLQMEMGAPKIKRWMEVWGDEYGNLAKNMSQWTDSIPSYRYEDLVGLNGPEVQTNKVVELSQAIKYPVSPESVAAIAQQSQEAKTMTSNDQKSAYEEWWDEELDTLFAKCGFAETNKRLGYQ